MEDGRRGPSATRMAAPRAPSARFSDARPADQVDRPGLRALLALPFGVPDLDTWLHPVKVALHQRAAMAVDLLPVRDFDEAVPLLGKQPGDATVGRRLVALHLAVEAPFMILQPPPGRIRLARSIALMRSRG